MTENISLRKPTKKQEIKDFILELDISEDDTSTLLGMVRDAIEEARS